MQAKHQFEQAGVPFGSGSQDRQNQHPGQPPFMRRMEMKLGKTLSVTIVALAFFVAVGAAARSKDSRSMVLHYDATVAGSHLASGEYDITWETHSPEATVSFLQRKQSRGDRRRESCGSWNEVRVQRSRVRREGRWRARDPGDPLQGIERSHRIQRVACSEHGTRGSGYGARVCDSVCLAGSGNAFQTPAIGNFDDPRVPAARVPCNPAFPVGSRGLPR